MVEAEALPRTSVDLAALVAFLASDDACCITGGIYPIDDGRMIR